MMLVDLQKAYDSVDRQKLLEILEKRAQTEQEQQIVKLIRLLHEDNQVSIGEQRINIKYGIA